MMKVWIHTSQKVFEEALILLLLSLGIEATSVRNTFSEVALQDLTALIPPYPSPPALPTLAMVSSHNDVVELLRQHYRGYIRPSDTSATLKAALEAVRRGEIWAERQVLTQALDTFSAPAPLTHREQQILELLTDGRSNRAIAKELGVVEGTVKMHVTNLFTKLGVKSRGELFAKVLHTHSPFSG